MTVFYGGRDLDVDDRTERRQQGLERLDRLARQGAADGGWISPPIAVPTRRLIIVIRGLLCTILALTIGSLVWAALVYGGVE